MISFMIRKPGITVVLGTLSLFAVLEILRLPNGSFIENLWRNYNGSIIEPLEVTVLFTFPIALYLLLFNQTIQQSWWRWARFALIVPFALIILLLPMYQNGGGFISFGGTTELVILWGVIFAAATLIHTLYQQFYLKTGVIRNN